MKVTRGELVKIIRESISTVLLNEYRGEQLNIPFNGGSTRAVNYEQYIDYVKSITKPGEIKSSIKSVEDYYRNIKITDKDLFHIGMNVKFYCGYARDEFSEDEYEDTLGRLEDEYGEGVYGENNNPWSNEYNIGEELSDYGFNCLVKDLIKTGKWSLDWMLKDLFNNAVDGMVYINRKLDIPSALGNYDDEISHNDLYGILNKHYGDLGYYWAYGKDNGRVYYGGNGASEVSLIAMTPIENIDMAETCALESVGEHEVGFIDDTKIMLVGLEIDRKEINIGHRVYK